MQLPLNQPVMGIVIDILSPKFPDNSSPQTQDFFCEIYPP